MGSKISGLEITYEPVDRLKIIPGTHEHIQSAKSSRFPKALRDLVSTTPFSWTAAIPSSPVMAEWQLPNCSACPPVPTIRLENLSPDQIRAYVIADNRLAERAGWDNAILAIELQHLLTIEDDFDITTTGFEIAEIDLILSSADDAPDAADNFAGADPEGVVARTGDLWLLGKHRLVCGSALEQKSYSLLMGNRRADVVFTDPPWNVPIDGHVCGNGSIRHREFLMASGEMSEPEFISFLSSSPAAASARYTTSGFSPLRVHGFFRHMGRAADRRQAGLRVAAQSLCMG